MTCLRARQVRLRVDRPGKATQEPTLVVPVGWRPDQVLDYARTVHTPLGHTVAIEEWGRPGDLWLSSPEGFANYRTGEAA